MASGKSKKLLHQGQQYQRKGNLSAALKCYEKAAAADAKNSDAWLTLGNIYFQQKQLQQAEKCFAHVVKIKPEQIEILNKLGVIYYYTRQHGKAIGCYQRILKKQPNNAPVHFNLAISLVENARHTEAVEHIRRSIALSPENSEAHSLLASSLTISGDFEAAKQSYAQARAQDAKNLDAVGGEAFCCVKLGDHQGAYERVARYVEQDVDESGVPRCANMSIAVAYAMTLKVHNHLAEAIAFLERVLKQNTQINKQRAQVHFEVAALYDKNRQFDEAFAHYKKANALVQVIYNKVQQNQHINDIISAFSVEKIRQLIATQDRTQQGSIRPIFIVGMPRSGTSLVEQILSCHSDVLALGESTDIQEMLNKAGKLLKTDLRYPQVFAKMELSLIEDLAAEFLARQANAGRVEAGRNISVVVNKLPHNFMYLGFINVLFPGAKIIHCTRNPIDTCLSNYFQLFSGALDYAYDLQNIVHHYRDYKKIMKHWGEALSIPVFELCYEDIICDQEKYSRLLLEYCGLDWQDACLSFYNSDRVVRTASNEQVRQPIHKKSLDRWKNYREHLGALEVFIE